MAFSITHLDGSMEQPNNIGGFLALLDELGAATAEHGDVAVEHESGWGLLVLSSGRVVWENVEDDEGPRHLDGLSRDKILELMVLVASGDVDTVGAHLWMPGYGS